jgi:hypothetical protein
MRLYFMPALLHLIKADPGGYQKLEEGHYHCVKE